MIQCARGKRRAFLRIPAGLNGFTLIELAVVLLIFGVTAAVVIPSMARPEEQDGTSTVRDVSKLLGWARQQAVARNELVTVHIDLATGAYVVLAETGGEMPDRLRMSDLALPPGTRLGGGRNGWATASFEALGSGRGDLITVITEARRYEMALDSWTGLPARR